MIRKRQWSIALLARFGLQGASVAALMLGALPASAQSTTVIDFEDVPVGACGVLGRYGQLDGGCVVDVSGMGFQNVRGHALKVALRDIKINPNGGASARGTSFTVKTSPFNSISFDVAARMVDTSDNVMGALGLDIWPPGNTQITYRFPAGTNGFAETRVIVPGSVAATAPLQNVYVFPALGSPYENITFKESTAYIDNIRVDVIPDPKQRVVQLFPTNLPAAPIGSRYSAQFSIFGADPAVFAKPYKYILKSGPSWLSMSADGVLTGDVPVTARAGTTTGMSIEIRDAADKFIEVLNPYVLFSDASNTRTAVAVSNQPLVPSTGRH